MTTFKDRLQEQAQQRKQSAIEEARARLSARIASMTERLARLRSNRRTTEAQELTWDILELRAVRALLGEAVDLATPRPWNALRDGATLYLDAESNGRHYAVMVALEAPSEAEREANLLLVEAAVNAYTPPVPASGDAPAVQGERDFETLVRMVLTPAFFERHLTSSYSVGLEEMAQHLSGNALQALLGRMATAEVNPTDEINGGRRWPEWEGA